MITQRQGNFNIDNSKLEVISWGTLHFPIFHKVLLPFIADGCSKEELVCMLCT